MTTTLPHLHTLEEVAEKYGLSLRSLKDQARRKAFRHIHFGNERRLTDAMLAELLAKYTVAPESDDELASVRDRVTRRASTRRPRQKAA